MAQQQSSTCEDFWLYSPKRLFMNPTFCPRIECGTEVANVLTRALIISLLVGGIFAYIYGFQAMLISLILIIVMMAPTIFAYFNPSNIVQEKEKTAVPEKQQPKPFIAPINVEGFANNIADYTYPTPANPFMNVLPGDSPQRPCAAPIDDKSIKQQLDDFFRVQWYSDPTDVFGKNQSQRQFVAMPVSSIPNDNESYKQWLYGLPEKTCKEGNGAQCRAGTGGGQLVWNNIL
jgi:hypothetical protein